MRRWLGISLAFLFMLPLVASLEQSAWANLELHPGSRLFYPLWDVSTPNRLTFIIVTREARREGTTISTVPTGTLIGGVPTIINRFRVSGTPGNCVPRGAAGSSTNVNRTDLGGTSTNPIFVDDLHFEYYGKTCVSTDETIHMSCADIDLFLLASPNNASGLRPRFAFDGVASEGRGALDVHLVTNGETDPKFRKRAVIGNSEGGQASDNPNKRGGDHSLMGHAIISDIAEGWAATYPAAAAKATSCGECEAIDGGTRIGYENYPMEVFLPFALADPFPTQGGGLRNVLSLWGPGLLPGANLNNTSINLDFIWWDGRERRFAGSVNAHSMIRPLGGNAIAGLDSPLDSTRFNIINFVCGHATTSGRAENDGFPRVGANAAACGAPDVPDVADPSDNFESSPDITSSGHQIQTSTPIGWWRFTLRRDGLVPIALTNEISTQSLNHSGRGLVGVVLSSTPGASAIGVGDATRLWHKDPCVTAQSSSTIGPPHVQTTGVLSYPVGGREIALFNTFQNVDQLDICDYNQDP